MSQQINLLNPDLRPRRDPLEFAVVAPVTLAALVLVGAYVAWVQAEQRTLLAQERDLSSQVSAAQSRVQATAKATGERRNDPGLEQEAQKLAAALQARRQVLQRLQTTELGSSGGFSTIMGGLARQTLEGFWLTSFAVKGGELELSGRLLDPVLLPTYIRRLNAEPSFQGRRFAELDMQAGGRTEPGAKAPAPGPAARPPGFVEFRLRTAPAAGEAGKTGGQG